MEAKTFKQGDIIHASFGYDGRITDFWKVIKATEKTVLVTHLKDIKTYNKELGKELAWLVEPDTEQPCGTPFRRKIKWDNEGDPYIEPYENLRSRGWKWDGEPIKNYCWH